MRISDWSSDVCSSDLLGEKIDDIFSAAIKLGMPLLPAEALGLGDGDAGHADFVKGLLHFIQLERLDDRLDFFHGALPSGLSLGAFRTNGTRLPLPRVNTHTCQVDSSPHRSEKLL